MSRVISNLKTNLKLIFGVTMAKRTKLNFGAVLRSVAIIDKDNLTCEIPNKETFAYDFWSKFLELYPEYVAEQILKGSKLRSKAANVLNIKATKDKDGYISGMDIHRAGYSYSDVSEHIVKPGTWLTNNLIGKATDLIDLVIQMRSTFDTEKVLAIFKTYGHDLAKRSEVVKGETIHQMMKRLKFNNETKKDISLKLWRHIVDRAYSGLDSEKLIPKEEYSYINTNVTAAKPCREPKGGLKTTVRDPYSDSTKCELWICMSDESWHLFAEYHDDTKPTKYKDEMGLSYTAKKTAIKKAYEDIESHNFIDYNFDGPKKQVPLVKEPKPKKEVKVDFDVLDLF